MFKAVASAPAVVVRLLSPTQAHRLGSPPKTPLVAMQSSA